MFNILEYKKFYLSEQSFYQFICLNEDLLVEDSCNTIFDFSSKKGQSIISIFPFVESLKEAIFQETYLFLPRIDISEVEEVESKKVFDFLFFLEEQLPSRPLICILRDVSKTDQNILEMQQLTRMTMLENEYLALQNKNIQLENELLQMRNKELQHSKELKTLFFSKISHELRSPVNGIMGLSQIILERENPQKELKSYVESICTASKHLRIILDDILDISRLETGNIDFQYSHFSLDAIIQHLQLNFLRVLEQKKLSLYLQVSPDVPKILIGDEVRLTQIFYNLISNAIKFTFEGSINIIIDVVKLVNSECRLKFCIADTGIGMTEEELLHIFEPYEQIGSLSYQELGGTGLGLSVVKQLVEIQNGSIQVTSQKNKGTSFTVELPFSFQEDTDKEQEEQILNFIGLSALVVDDSNISQLYTQKILEDLGFGVETCETGQLALSMLQKEYYDLLVTDITLPDLEGNTLVDIFEGLNPHLQKTSVIFVTGSIEGRKLRYQTLLKPYSQKQLWDLLKEVIPIEKTCLYSMEYLSKITDEKEDFIQDLIVSFLYASPEDMNDLSSSIDEKNADKLYRAVHKIKPMAILMGSQVLTRILLIIEKLSKQANIDWKNIERYNLLARKVAQLACSFFEKHKNV